jgi:arginine deiminase
MATPSRRRESLLSRAIFKFHPDFASDATLHEPLETGLAEGAFGEPAMVEGGDVLVLSEDVIAIGHSERTNLAGIRDLAASLATRREGPRWMMVVEIPKRRAYMHLDTLFTPIDREAALVHAPVLLEPGAERAHVFEVDLRARRFRVSPRKDFFSALARRGVGFEPVPCGGPDPLAQQREQWTDGANALAVAPGAIVMYDRNVATIEELVRRGWTIVAAEDLLLGREEVELDDIPRKVCVVLSSHELSRARGGPHCLTHPLVRDDLA